MIYSEHEPPLHVPHPLTSCQGYQNFWEDRNSYIYF